MIQSSLEDIIDELLSWMYTSHFHLEYWKIYIKVIKEHNYLNIELYIWLQDTEIESENLILRNNHKNKVHWYSNKQKTTQSKHNKSLIKNKTNKTKKKNETKNFPLTGETKINKGDTLLWKCNGCYGCLKGTNVFSSHFSGLPCVLQFFTGLHLSDYRKFLNTERWKSSN